MRRVRFRLTVWSLMVLVALSALSVGGWVLYERATMYRQKAQQCESFEYAYSLQADVEKRAIAAAADAIHKQSIRLDLLKARNPSGLHDWDEQSLASDRGRLEELRGQHAEVDAMANHYAALKNAYRAAASHPWLVPRADPPPPSGWPRVAFWIARREYGRALADLDELIRRNRYDPYLINLKAWLLATCPDPTYRDGQQAIESARRACELTSWSNVAIVDTLAAAYAESGDFASAIRWQREALDRSAPGTPDRRAFKDRLGLYTRGLPYREDPKVE